VGCPVAESDNFDPEVPLMLKRISRLPNPALVISLIALFMALGGTSYAADKVILTKHNDAKADKKLVKKLAPTLSVKHAKTANTATSAANANHATTADSATNATNATTAANATDLGGQPASSYLTTGSRIGTPGIVKAAATAAGNTVTLFTVGPFTVTMVCKNTGTGPSLTINATSSENNSVLNGNLVAVANTSTDVGPDIAASTAFHESSDVNDDFEAPSGAQAILVGAVGTNSLGVNCWANWVGLH
jgi:hypothetical protein